MIPTNKAKEKPLNASPPNTKRIPTTTKVVNEVMIVRLIVLLIASLKSGANSTLAFLPKNSLTLSNTTTVSFTE